MSNQPSPSEQYPGDNPIEEATDDTLGRNAPAVRFARQVLQLDATRGLVVGVLGPWGSGKTSFLNLAKNELLRLKAQVIDFNPWMFSGAEQLVDAFFGEISEELKLRRGLGEIGESLEEYGDLFSGLTSIPLVGSWIENGTGALKLAGGSLRKWKGGSHSRRSKVTKALKALSNPLIIVLDDIDRLSSGEIRDVFRLVRLTASFPNVVYLLAFDRERVERALGEDGIPGRAYLEKILQIATDLPLVSHDVLDAQVFASLDQALSTVENVGSIDSGTWPDLYAEIVRPLIVTMRDVRRYTLAARGTVADLGGQIALADVLALEAVRVFLPDTYSHLHRSMNALTSTASSYGSARLDDSSLKRDIDALLASAGSHREVARAFVTRLFPAAIRYIGNTHYGENWKARWLKDRRVAHEDVLSLYLERVAGKGFRTFLAAERALSLMADIRAFDEHLRSIELHELEGVIARLEVFEEQFRPEHVEPGVVVLLNLLYDVPDNRRGFLELGSRFTITRVTLRLLRSLKEPDAIEAAVKKILPSVRYLSARLEAVDDVGYNEHSGHELVSRSAAAGFEREWRAQVRGLGVEDMLAEPQLLRVLHVAGREPKPDEAPIPVPDDPRLTLKLLRLALNYSTSQTLGSRSVRRDARLSWDTLVAVFGTEAQLLSRFDALGDSGVELDAELSGLFQKYREGWRPD